MHQSEAHNQLSYAGYVALGGVNNPMCYKVLRRNGTHTYFTYHIRKW